MNTVKQTSALTFAGGCLLVTLGGYGDCRAGETVLYNFTSGGCQPNCYELNGPTGGVINVRGTLYGVTQAGGKASGGGVYSYSATTGFTQVYGFLGGNDGSFPIGELTYLKGKLYGVTQFGGGGTECGGGSISGCGTIFSVTPSGSEKVLHQFAINNGDGANPQAGLVNVNGTLYGTTLLGGTGSVGTVFSITPQGVYKVLYSFQGPGLTDAAQPAGTLLYANGMLFGTSTLGGSGGFGTIYSLTLSGSESVIYSFQGNSYGSYPQGGLINVGGTFFGVTQTAGPTGGTVFSVTPAGAHKVLHTFNSISGGQYPLAGLVYVGNKLYGTTSSGGSCLDDDDCGTLFSITTAGKFVSLYSFQGYPVDGAGPSAPLINVGRTFYGTTYTGGNVNEGTLFSFVR